MTTANIETAKKIVKDHGVKGFRKLKLKRPMWVVGRQTVHVNKHVALRMIDRLESEGFCIQQRDVIMSLIEKDLFDSCTITIA